MTRRAPTVLAAVILSACGVTSTDTPAPVESETEAREEPLPPSTSTPSVPAPRTPPSAPPPSMPAPTSVLSASGLRWELLAIPPRITMAERDGFRLRRQVTNEGNGPVQARTTASFTLDGARSMGLEMAFLNGGYSSIWNALPPGETVHDERAMGTSLFSAPGDYTIAMTTDGVTASTTVHVDP